MIRIHSPNKVDMQVPVTGISDAADGTNYQSSLSSPCRSEVKVNAFAVQYIMLLLKEQFMFPVTPHIFDACWMRDPLSAKYKVQARASSSVVFQIPHRHKQLAVKS